MAKFKKVMILLCAGAILAGGTKKAEGPEQRETESTETESIETEEMESDGLSETFLIEEDNRIDYQPGYECSAFASAYILRHYGEEAEALELFKDFPGKLPDESGVYPAGIKAFFQEREGYSAEFIRGGKVEDIKKLVSEGDPVIVYIHVKEPYDDPHHTHYVPVVGYDSEYLYFAESLEELANCKDKTEEGYNRKTEISEFERLWKDIEGLWDNPYFLITKE